MPTEKKNKLRSKKIKAPSLILKIFDKKVRASGSFRIITLIFGLSSVFIILRYLPKYLNGYTSICTQTGNPDPTFVNKNLAYFTLSILAMGAELLLLLGLKKYRNGTYASFALFFFILLGLLAVLAFGFQDPNFLCGIGP